MHRGGVHFGETEGRVSEENGAAHAEKRETKDCRQWKPGEGRAASARMFGSDGHIVRDKKHDLFRRLWSLEKISGTRGELDY
jgi:hypothetical protein